MTAPKPHHYVLSDLHLGHKNILGYCRPWFKSIEDHDDYIINKISTTCKQHDTLWLLGDIAFSKESLEKLSSIKCGMILIGGNHDVFGATTYLKYFKNIYGVAQMNFPQYPSTLFTHIPMHPEQHRWKKNIHGHLHAYNVGDDRYINASCEQLDFTPKVIGSLLNEKT